MNLERNSVARVLIGILIIAPVLTHNLVAQPWKLLCVLGGLFVVSGIDTKLMALGRHFWLNIMVGKRL